MKTVYVNKTELGIQPDKVVALMKEKGWDVAIVPDNEHLDIDELAQFSEDLEASLHESDPDRL